jgi:hypothetical protein
MSWKSREKKRRAKAAIANSRRRHPDRWYLTIVSRTCSCNQCGCRLPEGGELVYRNRPKWVLCLECANRQGVRYRLALRWERRNSKRKGGQLVPRPRQA